MISVGFTTVYAETVVLDPSAVREIVDNNTTHCEGINWHCVWDFDVSSIPDGSDVTDVQVKVKGDLGTGSGPTGTYTAYGKQTDEDSYYYWWNGSFYLSQASNYGSWTVDGDEVWRQYDLGTAGEDIVEGKLATSDIFSIGALTPGHNGNVYRVYTQVEITYIPACTPNAPTGLTATAQSTSQIDLSWTASNCTNQTVEIQRNDDGAGWTTIYSSTPKTSHSDTSLDSNESYQYRVRYQSDTGFWGLYSNITTEETIPGQVTGLDATAQSPSSINLSWNNIAGDDENGYKIETNIDGAGWQTLVANTGDQSTSYVDSGLSIGTEYIYRVSAISDGGTGAVSETTLPAQEQQAILELQSQIAQLQSQITSLNATVQAQQEDIDYLYAIWEDIRDAIISWLSGKP